jgi:leader peptidase (prepilin peptidase)/N-methyltransferase
MIFTYFTIALFGLIFGSFLNVVICRLPRNESIVLPRSHCMSCGKMIPWYDNIPILSFILLRGKCRFCRSSVSIQYPIIEVFTALLMMAVFWKYGYTADALIHIILILFLIPISVIDIQTGLILNKLTIPGFVAGIVIILALHPERWKEIPIGALSGGALLFLLAFAGKVFFKRESVGMGDVKLLVLIGAYLGFPEVIIAFYLGVLIAFVYIIIAFSANKIKLGETFPFGPFIASGTIIFILWGDQIIRWFSRLIHL